MSDVRFGRAMFALAAALFLAGVASSAFPDAIKNLNFHFEMPVKFSQVFVGMFLGGLASALPSLLGYSAWRDGSRLVATYELGKVEVAVGPVQPILIRRPARTSEHIASATSVSASRARPGAR